MKSYTVTIGADLRCYAKHTFEAGSKEEAKAWAVKELSALGDLAADRWEWKPEEVQGDISVAVSSGSKPADEDDFEPVPWRTPRYSELEAFLDKMSRFTTPEDEIADAGTGQPVDEFVADLDDERLCSEYATFMEMVRLARKIMKGGA